MVTLRTFVTTAGDEGKQKGWAFLNAGGETLFHVEGCGNEEGAGESVSDDEAGRTPKSSGGENVNGGHKGAREGRDCLAREEESRRAYIHTCTRLHPYVTESDGEKSAAASFGVDFAQHQLILPLCDSRNPFSHPLSGASEL
ncbi:hypothetical protein TNCT_621831 [Trichonephila clavata]|uniref:Uncharacterized protein n=1 Tax=Trichonephila clavata TaxID=2740835 RepID=A0A8X6GPM0_TRICU|nr:hypothetical protein TNCT_621831 [Trichonephila clavata]